MHIVMVTILKRNLHRIILMMTDKHNMVGTFFYKLLIFIPNTLFVTVYF